jgi:hypothetical protein
MAKHKFKVEEVNRDGYISWDAVEKGSGYRVPLVGPMVAGSYPEIEDHLNQAHSVNLAPGLKYDDTQGDRLVGQTWTYKRGSEEIIVEHIPRTIFRMTGLTA